MDSVLDKYNLVLLSFCEKDDEEWTNFIEENHDVQA